MKESLSQSPKFRRWKQYLVENGLNINEIEEIYTRYRHNGEALFSLLLLHATTPEGDKIPPICFLKGEVVSVMVILIDEQTGEKYALLVKQRRICTGGFIYEPVAGMVDAGLSPHAIAVKEVEEEAELSVHPDQVIAMNEEPYYVSTGTSDEAMYFFFVEINMSRERIATFHGRKTGLDHEHEVIWTHVATLPEARKLITNTNGLLSLYMYLDRETKES